MSSTKQKSIQKLQNKANNSVQQTMSKQQAQMLKSIVEKYKSA
jgi:hypothetical protein